MREVQVIARCDLKRCTETWTATQDTPPVLVSLPDGTQHELDLCPTHIKRLADDWLVNGREAYKRPAKTSTPGVGKLLQTPCPVARCASHAASASSMRGHIRKVHGFSTEKTSEMISQLFGTRLVKRTPCQECKESVALNMVSRHMFDRHGIVKAS